MKKILIILLVFAFFLPLFAVADVPGAVAYLQAQPQDAWITQALVASGQSQISTDHLTSVGGNLATDYAKAILALSALNINPATFGDVDYVTELKAKFNNGQFGETTLINDDAWAILALCSVGLCQDGQVQQAKDNLVNNQNNDGGWGYQVGGETDTNDTAAVIMALIEAGVSVNDQVISAAVNYLHLVQNTDGGFGWQTGSTSDSGSDAWVITALTKLGQSVGSWDKGGNNPISHLQSLQDTDGGFWWINPQTNPSFNNKAMTAFAVIALANATFPVGYYQPQNQPPQNSYHLIIEGQNTTLCDTQVSGTTALDLVINAASLCNYTYTLQSFSLGQYISEIAGESALGLAGWLYFVNSISPAVGAGDYVLTAGDEVLWYYGEWGWLPTRVTVNDNEIDPGQTIQISAQYFDGSAWQPIPDAIIKVGAETKTADRSGQVAVTINQNGTYLVYVQTPNYVRSNKITVTVGDTISQNVTLRVEVDQSGSGNVGGEAIALTVNPTNLDFGKLRPGQTATNAVNLKNEGTVSLRVGSNVDGEVVFISGIKINDVVWNSFTENLAPDEQKQAQVSLTVSPNYLASGIKTGQIIFWASSQ